MDGATIPSPITTESTGGLGALGGKGDRARREEDVLGLRDRLPDGNGERDRGRLRSVRRLLLTGLLRRRSPSHPRLLR